MKFKRLKCFRLKRVAFMSFKLYLKNIKYLMSDRLLSKQLVLAKHNDQSVFDDQGRLLMQEEDSIEEHNFFEVLAHTSTSINYRSSTIMLAER